ncbi:hypothetical protein FVR03_01380 [Pontibacter qinzhouensis]|uniref:Uncharacterized protein n=1 Tax=Pontibacter qinzhouensis TaxID=2603253 RepID=A0A5C8KE88_9BACT|nr:hypothetical protein [Pontibacter qinzhouensis]TXK52396.1 hypothetical protein FVR03_01380 [Pontibacter qinzhouensis]
MGAYSINNKDLHLTYGIIVESGSDTFLQIPKAKPFYRYDWGDENGVEIDHSEPNRFEPRNATLYLAILANTEAEFWTNYRAFIAEISQPGVQKLYIGEARREFYIKYESPGTFRRYTPLRGGYKIGAKFSVNFLEPNPSMLVEAPDSGGNESLGYFSWGYSPSAEVFDVDFNSLNFQFSGNLDRQQPTFTFTQAAHEMYLYIRTEKGTDIYTRWKHNDQNYGPIPDQVLMSYYEFGDHRYYFTRRKFLFDTTQSRIQLTK